MNERKEELHALGRHAHQAACRASSHLGDALQALSSHSKDDLPAAIDACGRARAEMREMIAAFDQVLLIRKSLTPSRVESILREPLTQRQVE